MNSEAEKLKYLTENLTRMSEISRSMVFNLLHSIDINSDIL